MYDFYWNSFGPKQRKTNLIDTLTQRTLKICSKSTLKHELENIRSILVKNGYPEFLIDSRISKKLLRFQQITKENPKKCPDLELPWIGENFLKFERKIKLSMNNCFGAVQPRVIFSTRRILPAIHKDVLPTFQQSNVVYEYVCHCDSRYVGRTSQRLQDRIRQHVSKSIRNRTSRERKQPERPGKLGNQYRTVIQRLETICYITKNVHLTIRTINFIFSLKHDPISIYQSWNQFSSLLEKLICVDRKNLFTNTIVSIIVKNFLFSSKF